MSAAAPVPPPAAAPPPRRGRGGAAAARLAPLAALALSLVPLWLYSSVPATDWPGHLAVARALVRWAQHDPGLAYVAHLQPVPYHLAYVLLAPAVWLLGPHWGGAAVLTLLVLALYASLAFFGRSLGLPRAALACLPALAYGPLFAWGFVATYAGLWAVVLVGALMLRQAGGAPRRELVWAAVAAALASAAHVILLLPVGLFCLGLLAAGARRHAAAALAVVGAGAATLVPLAVAHLAGGPAAEAADAVAGPPRLLFADAGELALTLGRHVAPWDRGGAAAGHAAGLLLAAGWAAVGWRSRRVADPTATAHRRLLAVAALGNLGLAAATPVEASLLGIEIWGLNFRFLLFAELGLLAWLASGWPRRPAVAVSLWAAGLLFVGGLWHLWARFDGEAAGATRLFAALPPGLRLQVVPPSPGEPYRDGWPHPASHLADAYVSAGGAYASDLFAVRHLPIRALPRPPGPPFDLMAVYRTQAAPAAPWRRWAACGGWQLYGPGPAPAWAARLPACAAAP